VEAAVGDLYTATAALAVLTFVFAALIIAVDRVIR